LPPPRSAAILAQLFMASPILASPMQGGKRRARIGIAQTVNERYMFALRSASLDVKFLDFRAFADVKSSVTANGTAPSNLTLTAARRAEGRRKILAVFRRH